MRDDLGVAAGTSRQPDAEQHKASEKKAGVARTRPRKRAASACFWGRGFCDATIRRGRFLLGGTFGWSGFLCGSCDALDAVILFARRWGSVRIVELCAFALLTSACFAVGSTSVSSSFFVTSRNFGGDHVGVGVSCTKETGHRDQPSKPSFVVSHRVSSLWGWVVWSASAQKSYRPLRDVSGRAVARIALMQKPDRKSVV